MPWSLTALSLPHSRSPLIRLPLYCMLGFMLNWYTTIMRRRCSYDVMVGMFLFCFFAWRIFSLNDQLARIWSCSFVFMYQSSDLGIYFIAKSYCPPPPPCIKWTVPSYNSNSYVPETWQRSHCMVFLYSEHFYFYLFCLQVNQWTGNRTWEVFYYNQVEEK